MRENMEFMNCHSERSEESTREHAVRPWILRCAQNDKEGESSACISSELHGEDHACPAHAVVLRASVEHHGGGRIVGIADDHGREIEVLIMPVTDRFTLVPVNQTRGDPLGNWNA